MNPVIVSQVRLHKGTDLKDGRQVLEGELGVIGMNGSRNREEAAQGQTSFLLAAKSTGDSPSAYRVKLF